MIIIPDVHGRPFWIQAARDLGGKEHFVFLGDYLDPYGYEGITPEMAFDIFQEVLDFKEAWPRFLTAAGADTGTGAPCGTTWRI